MAEIKDIAIAFKRIKDGSSDDKFVPYKVIEGFYSEEDNMFIDREGNTFYHITEYMNEGNCYGNRMSIGKIITSKPNKTLRELKIDALAAANAFNYSGIFRSKYTIIKENKKTKKRTKFKDFDTERAKVEYKIEDFLPTSSPTKECQQCESSKLTDEQLAQYKLEELTKSPILFSLNNTPQDIVKKLKETIKGQDKALEAIVTTIWSNQKFMKYGKKNMLIVGPTGVGKTAIFRELSKLLDIPMIVFSVPGLTQSGYVGQSVDEILIQLYLECGRDLEKSQRGIIILDEIDKLASKDGTNGFVATEAVQNELLKMLEGDRRLIRESQRDPKMIFDTSNITFIGSGAFTELHEKSKTPVGFEQQPSIKKITNELMVDYGLKRELIGRLPIYVHLNPLTKETLIEIILSEKSEFSKTIKILEELGIICQNTDELVEIIADDAISKGIGARGIATTISRIFTKIIYEVANNIGTYNTLTIDKEILNNPSAYRLSKEEKIQKPKKLVK